LNLEDTNKGWETLPQMVTSGFADMGCVNLSDTQVSVAGGWNGQPLSKAYVFDIIDGRESLKCLEADSL